MTSSDIDPDVKAGESKSKPGESRLNLPEVRETILGKDEVPSETESEEEGSQDEKETTGKKEDETDDTTSSDADPEKARLYDLIMGDQQAAGMLSDYFKAKSGRLGGEAKKDNGEDSKQPLPAGMEQFSARIEKLEAMNQHLLRENARVQIESFRKEAPDFDKYRNDISTIINRTNGGLTLNEAYELAKSLRAKAGSVDGKKTPLKSTERGGSGVLGREDDLTPFQEAKRKIDSKKAGKSFEDILDVALSEAIKLKK